MEKLSKKELGELKKLSKRKRLTREEWERLEELEDLKRQIEEEIIEQKCEKLANTIPIKYRMIIARDLFKDEKEVKIFSLIIGNKNFTIDYFESLRKKVKDKELFLGLSIMIYALYQVFKGKRQLKPEELFDRRELLYLKNTIDYIKGDYKPPIVIKTDPKDIGKKRYICEKCKHHYWIKRKPTKCRKCGSKKIVRYFRL